MRTDGHDQAFCEDIGSKKRREYKTMVAHAAVVGGAKWF